jgi:CubicO group peptidase (beta-lactamase class C family)
LAQTEAGNREICGDVAPGFEPVREEFGRNFSERGELGAACCAYARGEKVVDLWGGSRDRNTGAPWEEDTLVLVFSTTKGVSALAVALAQSRGLIDYDETVAAYWPEFAHNGKGGVTVRQLLNHRAGLCAVDEPLNPEVLSDLDRVAGILARQRPAWEPGKRQGYHYLTLGLCENELLRRVDPRGRSLGRFLREEIVAPLGEEFYVGLPPEVPASRVATIEAFHPLQMLLHVNTMPPGLVLGYLNPRSLTARTLGNPKLRSPGDLDKPEYRRVELGAAGGIGTARAVAKAYGAFAAGGKDLGVRPETIAELSAPAPPPPAGSRDEVLKTDTSYSLGFFKPSAAFRFGTDEGAFGTPGAGGSFGFADPKAGVGFAYAPNRMGFHVWDDPRERALREALYACLQGR